MDKNLVLMKALEMKFYGGKEPIPLLHPLDPPLVSLLIKLPQAGKFVKKETLAQVFSCEFCEISKNTFFNRTPLLAASAMRIFITCVDKVLFTNGIADSLFHVFLLRLIW